MKKCPICKNLTIGYDQLCPNCGLDLKWVKWRIEGIGAICLAIALLIVGYLLSNHAEWSSSYNGLFFQSYATHPYVGIGGLLSFVGGISLIAGIASTIAYDLKISNYSHKIEATMVPPVSPTSEKRTR